MHLPLIPQYIIQNRNVHIFVLNGLLWDMGLVHCGIYEIALLGQTAQVNMMAADALAPNGCQDICTYHVDLSVAVIL